MLREKIALLVGMMLVVVLYFWGHNVPETPFFVNLRTLLPNVGLALYDVILVSALAVTSGGIGRLLLGTHATHMSRAERVALESGLGLGILSLIVLAIGMIVQYHAGIWIIVLALLLVTIRQGWAWQGDFRAVVRVQPDSAWQSFIAWTSGFLLMLAFLLALAPPFAWDAMTYHLATPAQYLQDGRITTLASNHFAGFPQGMEMLYGLLMSVNSDSAPALLHFYTGSLALIATGGLIQRTTANANASALAVLLLLSSYSVWLLFGWAYVDLAMMTYGALILIVLTLWRAHKQAFWLVLAGALAGFALGVKYTAGGMIIALGLFVFLRQPRQVIRNGLIAGTAFALTFAPWAAKGLLLYDNPIYPYVFGGVAWDSLRSANFGAAGGGLFAEGLGWQVPWLPIAATVFGQEKLSPYAATLNIWLLTLPVALLLGWRRLDDDSRTLARDAALLAVPLVLFWMVLATTSGIGAQPRLMLIGAPVAAVLGTLAYHGITRWIKKPLDIQFILQAVIVITTLVALLDVVAHFASTRAIEYHTDAISETMYLANQDIYFVATDELQQRMDAGIIAPDSTVLFLWEPKSYDCPTRITCIPDVLYDNWARPILLGANPDTLMEQWRAEGVDYLLVSGLNTSEEIGYNFWLDAHGFAYTANVAFPAALAHDARIVWDGQIYKLYEWRE